MGVEGIHGVFRWINWGRGVVVVVVVLPLSLNLGLGRVLGLVWLRLHLVE